MADTTPNQETGQQVPATGKSTGQTPSPAQAPVPAGRAGSKKYQLR